AMSARPVPAGFAEMYIAVDPPPLGTTHGDATMWLPLLAIAVLQQQTTTPAQTSSPIATVTVRPSEAAIQVGDTIRLAASARDSAGHTRNDVAIRWFQSGGHFEGKVDSTGLVTGGATGTITVTALASPAAVGLPAPRCVLG